MHVKQRVSAPIIKLLYFFYKKLGYKSVYYSLYFVVFYYFIFASNVKKALKIYYDNLGIEFTNRVYFKHLFHYALTTSDRFISKANPEIYTFINKKRPQLLEAIKNGSILLSNHFGGWATASNYFKDEKTKINIVMNEAMIKNVHEFEKLINKKNQDNVNIINLSKGNMSTSISIANALINNESVALMADRALNEKHLYEVNFFEKTATFNKNPFLLAYKTKKTIIILFVIYKDLRTYEMYFETLNLDYKLKEDEAIKKAMTEYVLILSKILLQYPEQWFNFYNFWEKQ